MGTGDRIPTDLGSWAALLKAWNQLPPSERVFAFQRLSDADAHALFTQLENREQVDLLEQVEPESRSELIRTLDTETLIGLARHWPESERDQRLGCLDDADRRWVEEAVRARAGTAAGLMRSRFACLSPDLTVDAAIDYFRQQANRDVQHIYYAYVIDAERKLLGVVPFRQLFLGSSDRHIREIMNPNVITVRETASEEDVAQHFAKYGHFAVPVVDAEGRMKGILTSDNIVTRMQEEATEDIQKLGGMEALDAPYFDIGFFTMVKKRAGWLAVLFVGETLTATAMGHFEKQIERAVVLALFIPLIISSGGNSGSQATTLVIRAMALREIRLRDWWRVLLRELGSGVALGAILGCIGLARILLWPSRERLYGEHFLYIGFAVSLSLVGIVLWGTLSGAMLPFVLKKLGFDPASASAPFVATIVDVTGLIIYFSVASVVLRGVLL